MLKSPVETPKRTGSARPHKIFLFPPPATSNIKGITTVAAERPERKCIGLGRPLVEHAATVCLGAGAILWKVMTYHHSFINSVFLVSGWLCRKNGPFHRSSHLMRPAESTRLRWKDNETREKGEKCDKKHVSRGFLDCWYFLIEKNNLLK